MFSPTLSHHNKVKILDPGIDPCWAPFLWPSAFISDIVRLIILPRIIFFLLSSLSKLKRTNHCSWKQQTSGALTLTLVEPPSFNCVHMSAFPSCIIVLPVGTRRRGGAALLRQQFTLLRTPTQSGAGTITAATLALWCLHSRVPEFGLTWTIEVKKKGGRTL